MEREVGGGIGIGNTCKPMAVSFKCMTKFTTNKKKKVKKKYLLQNKSFLIDYNLVASLVAQTVKCLPAMWETKVRSFSQKDPLEKEMATHSSTLVWKIHGWRRLVDYSPQGPKESDTTEKLHFHFHFRNDQQDR